jgi:hypothetical protein
MDYGLQFLLTLKVDYNGLWITVSPHPESRLQWAMDYSFSWPITYFQVEETI